jgi:hypothetical protein
MTMVWGDPAGFAVDWDWQRGLTVWELAGRRSEPRFDRKVLEHELPARPAGERQAGRSTPLVADARPRSGAQRGQRKRQAAWVVIPDHPYPSEAPVALVRKLSASGCGQAGPRRCVAGRWRVGGMESDDR